ncbi:dephospho-CoA kinase [Falsihalocynthiibacter sp. SS001]|uniref:dephospho-CoA kinase n=1 Tax=Falsihalocynthiibacter sp. SS001 TaxID=3349698 RepID=UPI0036D38D93
MKRPFLLGLTGSIGMGKSTTANMFADLGCAVWDADAAVHRLYQGEAVAPIATLHPDAVVDNAVNRAKLKEWIKSDPSALSRIEAIIHPLVAADRETFIKNTEAEIVVLDIPLLFENGTEDNFDAIAVVSAPPTIQKERVLARGSMDAAMFEAILAKQMPDSEKRARADIVIPTVTMEETQQVVSDIVARIKKGAFDA